MESSRICTRSSLLIAIVVESRGPERTERVPPHEDSRHGRRRIHRLELRPPPARATTTHEVTVLDKLTYAGNLGLARRPARRPVPLREGRHPRCRARRRAVRGSRRRRALRRREPQRQLAREPPPVPRHQHRRHVHAPRGGARARHPLPPHLDRRGLRRPRARRPCEVHRETPRTTRRAPTRRRRPAATCSCAAWVALVRREGDDLELLEQLRPIPARREVHPAPDHQRPSRASARSCTARARTCATGSTRTTTRRRCSRSSSGAASARPTSSAPTASATTRRSSSSS